jgi:hypothetical protein
MQRMTIPALGVVTAVAVALTVTPARHDFGRVGVGVPTGTFFTLASSTGDSLALSITGTDAGDFSGAPATMSCADATGRPSATCRILLNFQPQSPGVKTASLVVTNRRGERATASLRGEGVAQLCEAKLVPCNYAHLYSGSFGWTRSIRSARASTEISVAVSVVKGVATCSGSQTMWDEASGRMTGPIAGRGLIAVEFAEDTSGAPTYNITAVCPTVDHPDMGGPSHPAELGGENEQQSYPQSTTAVGQDLVGGHSYPAPETDDVNGVTGVVTVRWDLKR